MNTRSDHQRITISYLTLRRLIGVVAIAHPVILFFGGMWIFGLGLQPSMSDYYWTGMRDVFVGIDFATGIFLLCYKGYGTQDRIAAIIAGTAAMLVALFPTPPLHVAELSSIQLTVGGVHAAAAITFLLAIAYFCLVLFVKSSAGVELSAKKRQRNMLYRICGVIILLVVALISVFVAIPSVNKALSGFAFIFWMEVTAFWAFGLAWLVKGKALLKD